jgi:hypothetical protein
MAVTFTRLVCVIALALLLPLQGLAAATTGMCLALGHHAGAAEHSHDGNAAEPHIHDEAPSSTAAHCGPCVACCAAAAISISVAIAPGEGRTGDVNAPAPPSFSGIPPKTLDRPPLVL